MHSSVVHIIARSNLVTAMQKLKNTQQINDLSYTAQKVTTNLTKYTYTIITQKA